MLVRSGPGEAIVLDEAIIIKVIAITSARVWLEIQGQEFVRVEQTGNNAVTPEGAD